MHHKHLTMALTAAVALSLITAAAVALCAHSVQADTSLSSPFSIKSHDPPVHEVGVAPTANVQATFDDRVDASTVTSATFVLHGDLGGLASGTFSYSGGDRTVTLDPDRAFYAGEVLRVSASSGIASTGAEALTPYGWQFTAGPVIDRCFGGFTDISTDLIDLSQTSVAWGDYDNDGDLDIVMAGWAGSSREAMVYRNDGSSGFTDIGAGLTGVAMGSVAWGDVDNDGDLDILLAGWSGSARVSTVYRNDGSDVFTGIGASLTGVAESAVAWGDYDNDGDLDILLTGDDGSSRVSKVYRNDGGGSFSDIGAALTGVHLGSVAWGDYDNDGDLDILLTGDDGSNPVSKVYRNDGAGTFTDIGALLTSVSWSSVAWGDYDNDGDLDILLTGQMAGYDSVANVYRNDGGGAFADIGAGLTGVQVGSADWGDVDNDGDLDILLTGWATSTYESLVYRNDGAGVFTDIGAGLTGVWESSVAWGDMDNDGDLDILLTGSPGSGRVSRVYRNNSKPDLGSVAPASGSGPTGVTTYFTTTWTDPDGWDNLKQCYFHIGDSPSIAGNVTLMYNAAKDKLWLRTDDGTAWLGGHAPESANTMENSQAIVDCSLTTTHGDGDTLSVTWAVEFKDSYIGTKKLGLKCKDRDKAKAKGKWMGSWTITS